MVHRIISSGRSNDCFTILLIFLIFTSALALLPLQARAESWIDDFSGPGLDPRWVQGWVGQAGDSEPIHIRTGGGIYAHTYTEDDVAPNDWHGPRLITDMSTFSDFDITARFRCIAQELQINRLMVRVLDQSENQLYSFGWGDFLASDSKAEIGLYGSSDAVSIYKTESSYAYSNFYDKDVRLVKSGQTLSFYIDGFLSYTGTTSTSVASHVDVYFMKFSTECTNDVLDLMRISVSTTQVFVPGPPEGLKGNAGPRFVALTWSTPQNTGGLPVTSYKIYRGAAAGSESYLTAVTGTQFNDTGLTNGQTYFYRVSALNAVGEGGQCPAISSVPMTVPDAPSSISSTADAISILVSWNPPASDGGSAITGYHVYRSTDSNPASHIILSTVTEFHDTEVTSGQPYHYWVAALNSVGEGSLSEEVVAIPGSSTSVPSEPRNLVAMPGDGKVTLTWSPPLSSGNLPLLGFKIYRGNALDSMTLKETVALVQTYVDTSVVNGQEYIYHVTAFNSLGESAPSDDVTATPRDDSVPSEPNGLAMATANHSATLSWSEPEDDGGSPVIGYRIYRGASPGGEAFLVELGIVHTYTDVNLVNNRMYYYKVAAFSALGEGPAANCSAKTPQSASPDEDDEEIPVTPPSWTDNFTVTSAISTVVALVVGIALMFLFLRSGGPTELASKDPDEAVDDEPEDDGPNEERSEDPERDLLPEGGA